MFDPSILIVIFVTFPISRHYDHLIFLLSNTAHSVTISIRFWVQFVQDACLFASSSSASGIIVSCPRSTGASASAGMMVATKSTANSSRLALKPIIAFLATCQTAALLLEVSHADGGQCGCGMVLGFVLVDFVNGDRGVDDGGLNGFFLYDGLDGLRWKECQYVEVV